MVSVAGLGCKQYREQMDGGAVPEISCPDPECPGTLRGHGWYRRYLGGVRQPLRRVRCPRCKVSHAVLPEDLCAYRDLTFGAVEAGLAAGTSERGRRGLGAERSPGGAASARLAAQRAGALCREASGSAGAGVGSVVARGAGGGGQGGGLADAAAALGLVELSLFPRRGERSFPPRPAGRPVAAGLSIGW